MKTKRDIALAAALVFALFATMACDEAFDEDGEVTQNDFVDSCVEEIEVCMAAEGDEESFDLDAATTQCESDWQGFQDDEPDPEGCAAAWKEYYDCMIAENCSDDADVCMNEFQHAIDFCEN